jgi:N6-L-threonylcarbamoyladenine synthase
VECILPTIEEALRGTGVSPEQLDAIAVTRGPGLLGSLLVGTTAARTLGMIWKKPIVGVHHTLGHLSSTWLDTNPEDQPQFPLLTLSASGGHTELWLRTSHTKGTLLGRTRDDAAGEAFDKGAKLLGLPYPGGPAIGETGREGNPRAFVFPKPLKDEDGFDFSFSGLKTSLRYLIRDTPDWQRHMADLCASYEHALCAHLCARIETVLDRHPEIREVHCVGGVSANTRLRTMLKESAKDLTVRFPSKLSYCTDNAAMIAAAGYFLLEEQPASATRSFGAIASLPLNEALNATA